MEEDFSDVYLQMTINKANPGETDEDGNYIFEVEASNENLDLQNQIVQQKALTGSKEYFLTNGVISDDHQHKTRNENGEVEKNMDKIIGEPLKVWTDGKKTFVKGKLYGNNKFAKGYINLLKANSSRVHASVGGIMPKIRKNADGTETVTSFMWNDLALTTSPVNWTVGSAHFAKSLSNVEFCKALTAGAGTDAANFTDGRALQNEDTEKKSVTVDPENTTESDDDIVKECVMRIDTGEFSLKNEKEIVNFLKNKGFNEDKARETVREIIKQGESKMAKGILGNILDLAKSMKKGGDEEEEVKKLPEKEDIKDEEDEDTFDFDEDDDDEDESEDSDDEEEEVKKGCKKCVTKSMDDDDEEYSDDDESEYHDATEIMNEFSGVLKSIQDENAALRSELEETQNAMLEVTKSLQGYLNTPQERKTVVQKSMDGVKADNGYVSVKPDSEDFKTFKDAVAKSIASGNTIDPYEITALNSTFQKSMRGEKILKSDWNKICSIVNGTYNK